MILDEVSLAGTLSLDRITSLAATAGAKVLLVGDYAQLQSVDAGGAFSLLVHDRDDAPELVDVHRFMNPWEKTASLGLRHGRTEVIDTYLKHGRIIGGETQTMIDTAYAAWRADRLAERATVLVTDSNESVLALNQRARTDLILDGTVNSLRRSSCTTAPALRSGIRSSPGTTTGVCAPAGAGSATATGGQPPRSATMAPSLSVALRDAGAGRSCSRPGTWPNTLTSATR